ncbi:redoxin domain-containing protein [candidate division KSB1 bacterium]|nr:redoxin domain-containing protein [candidate division KSB1 bacterium]
MDEQFLTGCWPLTTDKGDLHMRAILKLVMSTLLVAIAAWAQTPGVGNIAPDFTHASLDHGQIKLSDYRGKVVYLFFLGHN